jgi:hypothetical protein
MQLPPLFLKKVAPGRLLDQFRTSIYHSIFFTFVPLKLHGDPAYLFEIENLVLWARSVPPAAGLA